MTASRRGRPARRRQGEQHALGEELSNEAAPIGAQGRAHGHFLRAAGGLRHQQVRDVHARDEQHAADGDEQRDERGSRVADVVVEQGHGVHAGALVGRRMLELQAIRQRREFGIGVRERGILSQARDDARKWLPRSVNWAAENASGVRSRAPDR